MAMASIIPSGTIANAVCEVCKRLNNDWRPKRCQYCAKCGAWICMADLNNWVRRAMAAVV